jgi:cytochrome c biogenesis protein CcmG/thiol:disulfide interchange protein DsbE
MHPALRILMPLAALAYFLVMAPLDTLAGKEGLEVGSPPPETEWLTASGDTLGWGELHPDRPLVMVFWATWCASCKKEWPELIEFAEELGEEGPAWAAVSLGEKPEKVEKEAAKRGLPGHILVDPKEKNGKLLGVEFIPTVCVLDAEGEVIYLGAPHVMKIRSILESQEGE